MSKAAPTMLTPRMSGHCGTPQTAHPEESHARCARNGGGNTANPTKTFQPCPCGCHLGDEVFDCGSCGRPVKEAPLWISKYGDEVAYVHVDKKNGRALGEDCL